MDKREQMIRLWFSMWLEKKDLGMDDIFAENVSYTERGDHVIAIVKP